MTRKRIAIVLGGALGVMTAALMLAVVLQAGGTAEATAPPSYTKVAMPDFGQHSQGWCWVASAANSFWWYAHNTTVEDGLLGGAGHPWDTIDPASTTPGSACAGGATSWYDANDVLQGAPGVVGYMRLLSKIAATTFRDKVQDGVRDPDGLDNIAGTADDETNYCYSEGVEKWDYLIGLRDFVKNYGWRLAVHDIIDPAWCGLHIGFLPNRATPGATNNLNPCGPGNGGVPGVDQQQRVPTLTDYMEELSASQDVLLWMEPQPGSYPEYVAHVVAGVGYDTVPAQDTVTISDPWTRNGNPPVPPHSDIWNNANPSHNNAPGYQPSPYALCTVVTPAPFVITCPNPPGDPPTVWRVVDMIFVSPSPPWPVGGLAELPGVGGSSGANSVLLAGLAAAAALAALTAGAWYARRRFSRG